MPKPTVGRIAAVFEEGGQLSALTGWRTYRSEASEPHFWHWPERED
jgi:hypothetical protein